MVTTASDGFSHTGVSLRDAIALANADAAAGFSDTITFAASLSGQTITLTQGALNPSGVGAGTIAIDGGGQITVSGSPVGSADFIINAGVSASIAGLVISNGKPLTSGIAGGVQNSGFLTMTNCVVTNNQGNGGSGLKNLVGATAMIVGCTFTQNTDAGGGGCLNNDAVMNVVDSTISGNAAGIGRVAIGNFLSGQLTVIDSLISGNSGAIAITDDPSASATPDRFHDHRQCRRRAQSRGDCEHLQLHHRGQHRHGDREQRNAGSQAATS